MADGSAHLEVESVLDVDAGFALPELRGVAGIAEVGEARRQELDATYFDTADLALIRAGITLRRRTGGDDAGWHLKLPAGKDTGSDDGDGGARLELRRPLGPHASAPPAALLALVQAWARGRPVEVVARLRTTRTAYDLRADDGRRLAELADDVVTAETRDEAGATSTVWRELEVELDAGQPDGAGLLAEVGRALGEAGARPSRTPSKLGRALAERLSGPARPARERTPGTATGAVLAYLDEQVAELLRQDPLVRADRPDSVHAMRVACRRLRSTLAAFRPVFEPGMPAEPGKPGEVDGERLRAEVSWIAGVLGAARDAEVMKEKLLAELDRHPEELMVGPVGRRIELELSRRYARAHADAVRALDSVRHARMLDDLEAFLADPPLARLKPKQDTPRLLTDRVRKAHRRLVRVEHRAARADDQLERDELLHEVRKAAKRSRYAAEVLKEQVPELKKQAKGYEKAAKAVQEVLGDHHDAVVERGELMGLARLAERAGESSFGYGVMHADLGHRRALDEQEFARAWHDLQREASDWPG